MIERDEQYNPNEIEPKWQRKWEKDGVYHSDIDPSQPKHYALTMLPYPSGDLHMGHWFAMTPSDARARYMRMKGYNVMFPMGFDAFGLPAENAAIQRNIHPKEWTYDNIERMRVQLRSMGAMYDWRREAVSSDPEYYHWTQWFFIQLYNHKMAYRKDSAVDWCPNCNTTLAREQVIGESRLCERCGTPVVKKQLEQWFFTTTDYAEELLDFSDIDWPERVQTRCGGQHLWCWPPNIRWLKNSPPPNNMRKCMPTRSRLPARAISTANRRNVKRPASLPVDMQLTRLMRSVSRSGSRIMS